MEALGYPPAGAACDGERLLVRSARALTRCSWPEPRLSVAGRSTGDVLGSAMFSKAATGAGCRIKTVAGLSGQRVAYIYRHCTDQVKELRAALVELGGGQSRDFAFGTREERELVKQLALEYQKFKIENIRCGAFVEMVRVSCDSKARRYS